MKISELYEATSHLGFTTRLEDDVEVGFVSAANHAIIQVNALRPNVGSYLLEHRPLKNLISEDTTNIIEVCDDTVYSAESPRAYYFEATGKGNCYIEALISEEWATIGAVQINSEQIQEYKGFIKDGTEWINGPVRLRFCGDCVFLIKNIAMYGKLHSNIEDDIPSYGGRVKYDLSKVIPNFQKISSVPSIIGVPQNVDPDIDIVGDKELYLPTSSPGTYKITYNTMPKLIDKDIDAATNETDIGLDEDLCSLLPLCIAAYVYLDDEPKKSKEYLDRYYKSASIFTNKSKDFTPVKIRNKTGW